MANQLFTILTIIVVAAFTDYRLASIPSQKIAAGFRDWLQAKYQVTEVTVMGDEVPELAGREVRKIRRLAGGDRWEWLYELVTCPECFGWWLALPSVVLASAIIGGSIGWALAGVALWPAVAGVQQYLFRTDSNL